MEFRAGWLLRYGAVGIVAAAAGALATYLLS
jgi:hypothetical protein